MPQQARNFRDIEIGDTVPKTRTVRRNRAVVDFTISQGLCRRIQPIAYRFVLKDRGVLAVQISHSMSTGHSPASRQALMFRANKFPEAGENIVARSTAATAPMPRYERAVRATRGTPRATRACDRSSSTAQRPSMPQRPARQDLGTRPSRYTETPMPMSIRRHRNSDAITTLRTRLARSEHTTARASSLLSRR